MKDKTKAELKEELLTLLNDYNKLAECYDYALDFLSWCVIELSNYIDEEQYTIIKHKTKVMEDLIQKRISNDEVNR